MTGYESKKAMAQDKLESMEREALKLALEALKRIKTYGDVFLSRSHEQKPYDQVCEAIEVAEKALAQPAQEPVAGTKTWFEDGKVVTQYLTAKDIYKEPAQDHTIPSSQEAASKVGPFWQEFSVVYEAIGKQKITIREIAWRCFLAAKTTTQPAQEQNFCPRCGKRTKDIHTCTPPQENT